MKEAKYTDKEDMFTGYLKDAHTSPFDNSGYNEIFEHILLLMKKDNLICYKYEDEIQTNCK